MSVRIYKLDKGFSAFFWLCGKCLEKKRKKGWELVESRSPPFELKCQECDLNKRR